MNTRHLHLHRARPVLAALLAGAALVPTMRPAYAQDSGGVSDFRLPPGPERPATPVQGPVDDQVPVVRPSRAAPPEPVPQPAATPTAAPAPPAAATSSPVARPEPAVRARPADQPEPAAQPAVSEPQPLATPTATIPTVQPSPEPAVPTVTAPAAAPAQDGRIPAWLLALVAVAGLGGLALWFVRRRPRRQDAAQAWPAEPAEAEPQPVAPSPPASLPPAARQTGPRPPAAPAPSAQPAVATAGALAVELEAHHLSRSLIYVTLAYRLTITNRGAEALGPLRVAADLASAHASKSREAQLRPAPGELEHRHAVPAVEAGESVALTGELRLPVAAITAIRQGEAQLFVPLARFLVERDGAEPRTLVFVIGQPGESPGAGLRPFRIDAMPGVFRDLDQREIALAA